MKAKYYYLFDCKKFILGRMAAKIAFLLEGKNKACYKPNVDEKDVVIVINSDKLKVTGGKKEDKMYHSFSGYPGGVSSINLGELVKKDSRKVIQGAVYGMLPKNKMRDKMMKRLLVFKDENHGLNFSTTEITRL